ncbi:MAG: hypothetical protein WA991_12055 [Ornithinimicrobium sp.]
MKSTGLRLYDLPDVHHKVTPDRVCLSAELPDTREDRHFVEHLEEVRQLASASSGGQGWTGDRPR